MIHSPAELMKLVSLGFATPARIAAQVAGADNPTLLTSPVLNMTREGLIPQPRRAVAVHLLSRQRSESGRQLPRAAATTRAPCARSGPRRSRTGSLPEAARRARSS